MLGSTNELSDNWTVSGTSGGVNYNICRHRTAAAICISFRKYSRSFHAALSGELAHCQLCVPAVKASRFDVREKQNNIGQPTTPSLVSNSLNLV
jgi:hypothetical protein